MDQVEELEQAILAQANRLASEYRERAERSRDNILREAGERLHLREEREVLLAKAKAERAYRRRVQANELQLRKEMDHLRWNLVEEVRG
ncbi:MAG: ATPase, partial [Gammaproteobacteria bacterium]|nr:ATPase [Gammaproteobacteria bacterium]